MDRSSCEAEGFTLIRLPGENIKEVNSALIVQLAVEEDELQRKIKLPREEAEEGQEQEEREENYKLQTNRNFFTMANKTILAQVAFFVFSSFLVFACASEVRRTRNDDSSFKKIVDFKVHISETGEEYNEKIEVDTDKETELFKVPAHPGVDRSDVLHDFKQNLTMLRLPDKAVCYLLPLINEQSSPQKLIEDLERADKKVLTGEMRRIDNKWTMDSELLDRSDLSDNMANMCAKYPIYRVREMSDTLTSARLRTTKETSRKRRQLPINKLCPGGMDFNKAFSVCYPKNRQAPSLRCKVIDRTCYKFVVCKTGPTFRPHLNNFEYKDVPNDCKQEHIYNSIVCCEYYCN